MIRKIKEVVTRHLEEVDENYFSHFKHSFIFSLRSLMASVFFLIHAVAPFMFVKNGSKMINKLHQKIESR
jgi:hypothetical protein